MSFDIVILNNFFGKIIGIQINLELFIVENVALSKLASQCQILCFEENAEIGVHHFMVYTVLGVLSLQKHMCIYIYI